MPMCYYYLLLLCFHVIAACTQQLWFGLVHSRLEYRSVGLLGALKRRAQLACSTETLLAARGLTKKQTYTQQDLEVRQCLLC
jgi:ERCC4-type nuclease